MDNEEERLVINGILYSVYAVFRNNYEKSFWYSRYDGLGGGPITFTEGPTNTLENAVENLKRMLNSDSDSEVTNPAKEGKCMLDVFVCFGSDGVEAIYLNRSDAAKYCAMSPSYMPLQEMKAIRLDGFLYLLRDGLPRMLQHEMEEAKNSAQTKLSDREKIALGFPLTETGYLIKRPGF